MSFRRVILNSAGLIGGMKVSYSNLKRHFNLLLTTEYKEWNLMKLVFFFTLNYKRNNQNFYVKKSRIEI